MLKLASEPPGVRQGAQAVDVRVALEVRQDARCAARSDQQVLVAKLAAVIDPHAAALRVESHGAPAECQLDPLVGVPAGGPEPDLDSSTSPASSPLESGGRS